MNCPKCNKPINLAPLFQEFAELWEDAESWAYGALYCPSCEEAVGSLELSMEPEVIEELVELNKLATSMKGKKVTN